MFRLLLAACLISATLAKPQRIPPVSIMPWNGMGGMLPPMAPAPVMPGFGMIPSLPGLGGAIGSQIGVCELINKLERGEIKNVFQLMMIASQMNLASLAQGCQQQSTTTARPQTTWRTSTAWPQTTWRTTTAWPQSTQRSTTSWPRTTSYNWGSGSTGRYQTSSSWPQSTSRYYSNYYDY